MSAAKTDYLYVTYVNDIISYIPWYQIDKSTLFDNCVKKKGL